MQQQKRKGRIREQEKNSSKAAAWGFRKKLKNGLLVYQFKVSSSANERRLLPLRYLGF